MLGDRVDRAAVARNADALAERTGSDVVGACPLESHLLDRGHLGRSACGAQAAELRDRQAVEDRRNQADLHGVPVDDAGLQEDGREVAAVRVGAVRVGRGVGAVEPLHHLDRVQLTEVDGLEADRRLELDPLFHLEGDLGPGRVDLPGVDQHRVHRGAFVIDEEVLHDATELLGRAVAVRARIADAVDRLKRRKGVGDGRVLDRPRSRRRSRSGDDDLLNLFLRHHFLLDDDGLDDRDLLAGDFLLDDNGLDDLLDDLLAGQLLLDDDGFDDLLAGHLHLLLDDDRLDDDLLLGLASAGGGHRQGAA